MKKTITMLMVLGLVFSLVACSSSTNGDNTDSSNPNENTTKYTAGTYTGTARGREGDITVEVTYNESAIESIVVKEHNDTKNIFDAAFDVVSNEIINHQSLAVESVSGATISANGIVNAVKETVAQAGGNVEDLMTEIIKENNEVSLTADVVVVGAGGAGLAAALEAANNGAKVIVVEAQAFVGGSTGLSTGMVIAEANEDEMNEHHSLSAEEMVEALKGYSTEYFDADMSLRFLSQSRENMDWAQELAEEVGHELSITYDSGFYDLGREWTVVEMVTKSYAETGIDGPLGFWITDGLYHGAVEVGIEVYTNTRANEILTDENGQVTGIGAVNGRTGNHYTINAKSVVLASGGFGANVEMKETYTEEPGVYVGAAANDGFAIVAAGELGAKLRYGMVPDFGFGMLYNTIGGVVINENAQVLNENDEPISGLYSAGEMACVTVMDPPHLYSGHNNAWGLYSGRLAGANAAENAK